ncbi:hypothetical protein MCAMS1_00374 [biofilm metagenome]
MSAILDTVTLEGWQDVVNNTLTAAKSWQREGLISW